MIGGCRDGGENGGAGGGSWTGTEYVVEAVLCCVGVKC
jgi:hypothetical protein